MLIILGYFYKMYIKPSKYFKIKHIISYLPPVILNQPVGGIARSGGSFVFEVILSNTKLITYQWYRNGSPIQNTNNNKLTLSSLSSSDTGTYYCSINYKTAYFNTDVVTLEVKDSPTIITQPINLSLTFGSNSAISVSATGSEPITYRWYKNDQPLNGTTNIYYINNFQTSDIGNYKVLIKNDVGEIFSNTVTISTV